MYNIYYMIKITVSKTETNARLIRRFKKVTRFQRLKFREKEYFIKPNKRKTSRF